MADEKLLNKILEMNIQGEFFVYYHILRPGWIDEDGGYHHGITGTFFACVTWVLDTFENNKYTSRFLAEVLSYLEDCGAPDEDAESICSMYDKNKPGEEYEVYIRRVS